MEELSIEEKAKRYDIALDKIKMLLGTGSSISREELKYVFPELAESDDEMIRKDLLYWLYSYKDGNETFVPAEDVDVWISYLEKQGEQQDHSKFLDSIQIGDQVTKNEDGVLVNLSQLKRVAKTEDKVEQKPEWSEEDEAIYYGVIETEQYMLDVVNGIKKFNVGNISIKEECQKELDWLKSLKDRVQPQPKQEWGDEDNEHIKSIISTIECSKAQFPNSPAVLEAYNSDLIWLKSLRPHSSYHEGFKKGFAKAKEMHYDHWKPSDEQMLAINTAINVLGKGTLNGKQLIELEEQLKKLREE